MRGRGGQNNRQRCASWHLCLLQQTLGQKCARGARLLLLLRWLRRLLLRCNGRKLLAHSVHSGAEWARRAGRAGWWVWYAAGAAPRGLFSPHGCQALHHADVGARLGERQAHQLQSGRTAGWVQCFLSACSRLWRSPKACKHSFPPNPTTTLLRNTAAYCPPPLTCWRLRMCSTLASSSSWHVLCRRGTLALLRCPPPPPPPGAPHTQLLGVLPAVHRRMDWLADALGLQLLPGCPGAPEAPGSGSRLSAPGSVSTTRWRVAQPRRCRENAAGSGGLREETGSAVAGVQTVCTAVDACPRRPRLACMLAVSSHRRPIQPACLSEIAPEAHSAEAQPAHARQVEVDFKLEQVGQVALMRLPCAPHHRAALQRVCNLNKPTTAAQHAGSGSPCSRGRK